MAVKKTIELNATTDWNLWHILANLINGDGWKGFGSGIDSRAGKVKVTVIVERVK